MKRYDYLVVGAGFAGATVAERLASFGYSVLVVEKRDHIGGNCYDYRDKNGILVQKYGPHIFHTNKKEVWEYLSKFTKWNNYKHKVVASLNEKDFSLPVSLKTIKEIFEKEKASLYIEKLLNKYGKGSKVFISELLSSSDDELRDMANAIFKIIYFNYSKKQWGCDPRELSPVVLDRLPLWLDEETNYFKDSFQGMPEEGFSKIFEKMLDNKKIEVVLNKDYKSIVDSIKVKKIFYTGPIDYFFDYKYGNLEYRALSFNFDDINSEFYQNNSVVNYVGPTPAYTRVTEFKHFYSTKSENTVILKEFPEDYREGINVPCYPVPKAENFVLCQKYGEEALKLENVVFLGRLAEYKYYNMDEVVERALCICEEKF